MVLAVPGQQVLADPTEGEVSVVEALEVGLARDKTLPWKDPEGVRGEAFSWQGRKHIKTACPSPRVPRCPFPQDNQNQVLQRTANQLVSTLKQVVGAGQCPLYKQNV